MKCKHMGFLACMGKKLMMTKFVIAFGGKGIFYWTKTMLYIRRVSLIETQGTYPTVAFELIFQVTGMLPAG